MPTTTTGPTPLADARFAAFCAEVAEARQRPAGCAVTTLRGNDAR
jgi:hypothetical protein